MLLLSGFIGLIAFSAWETPKGKAIRVHSFEYFVLCMLGGILSGLPHTILTPIDVVKCRVQVGEYSGLGEGFRKIWHEASQSQRFWVFALMPIIYRGWAPTFVGYSLQGALKFGLYEFFKYVYAVMFPGFAKDFRVILFLSASATAEMFADVALCPWEAVKIKMQTTRTYPPLLSVVMPRMWAGEGFNGFFKGLSPLWGRQVPYTMVKFSVFEKIVEFIYNYIVSRNTTQAGHLAVSLGAGCLAGTLCAIVSHPADTLVSKMNQKGSGEVRGFVSIARDIGCKGLWKGLLLRIAMIGILTSMQWLIYDSFKVIVGLPTTGSSKK